VSVPQSTSRRDYYLGMAGGNEVAPQGRLVELMQLAEEQRSVTAAEIADVLDVDQLPVEYESQWSFGRE
jgi:hypothetical protein